MDRLKKVIEIMTNEYSKTCGECGEREDCEGCKYWNVDCNLDYLIEVLLKWDKTIPKEKNIVLKDIDTSMSFHELRNKLIEDREKFEDAAIDCMFAYYHKGTNTEEYKKKAIEAFWNMIQTGLELIQKIGISADKVMEKYPKHLQKIKQHDYKLREKVQK